MSESSSNQSGAAAAAAAAQAEPSSSGQGGEAVKVGEERKGNCMVAFDALWLCYSPRYQWEQYYIYGKPDDCFSKWTDLTNCLKRKTVKYKEEVLQADADKRHPVWDIRTHAEAREFWAREFGHLSGEAGQRAEAAGSEEPHHSGRPTLV